MSLMIWTLALAGAAMGVRHMSNRHRQRLSGEGDSHSRRSAQDDRDAPNQWSPPAEGMGSSTGPGVGTGVPGNAPDGGPGTIARTDDLMAPDSELAPGQSANRF